MVAILLAGIMEMGSVASVMPFMAIIARPEVIHESSVLSWLYLNFGFTSQEDFLFFSGLCVLVVLLLSNAVSAGTTWLSLRMTHLIGHSLSLRLLIKYVRQPYIFFLDRNTAELTNNLLAEATRVVNGVLVPTMRVIEKLMVTLAIFSLLLYVNAGLAVTVAIVIGGIYTVVFALVRRLLMRAGKQAAHANRMRYQMASEVLSGVKDIKLLGREETFIKRFAFSSREFAVSEARHQVISQMPRYLLEVLAFGGVLIITLFLISSQKGLQNALPLIALYALSGYRLMPAAQHIFGGLTNIRYYSTSLDLLYRDLTAIDAHADVTAGSKPCPRLRVKSAIHLHDVTFAYPGVSRHVFKKLSLSIKARTTVGLAGTTGSGKTTVIDVILGLLMPNEGRLVIDGTEITDENRRAWQNSIGYVPQQIYLSDDTIRSNIAFGVPTDEIDDAAVEHAARVANIHEFIASELAAGYRTMVGERGVRLSGGQRQRIGIARALYHDPDVLVFDEATSALDSVTEATIIEALARLAGKKTIILVAHRLTTLKDCDAIYLLEKGKVLLHGRYDELFAQSPHFRRIAGRSTV